MKEIFKAGLYRLMFQAFNFLVGLFIAAIAGADLFGTISLMFVNAAFLLLVTGLGADQAIVWHGASKKLNTNKLFTFSFLTALFQIVLFLAVAIFFLNITGKSVLSKSSSNQYFFFELFYFCGIVLMDKYVSLFYAAHKARICNLLLASVNFIVLLILAASRFKFELFEINPFPFFCMLPVIQSVVIGFYFHVNTHSGVSKLSRDDLNSLFTFSVLVFISNIIQFLAYRADYWLIDYFSNSGTQLGIYAQANKFAALLWITPNIIAALLAPVISSPQSNFERTEVAGLARIFNFLNLFFCGLIISVSFFIYTYFLSPEYFNGFIPLLYMLPGFYFFSILLLLAAYFSAKKNLWVNLVASSICFLIIVILDIILIPAWGIKGAAIANSVAYFSSALFTIFIFLRQTDIRLTEIFFLKKSDWKLITKLRV
jgi:O-antigen/teichoic acid export membrane protein